MPQAGFGFQPPILFSERLGHGPLRHHADEVGAIIGARMDVGVHHAGIRLEPVQRFRLEALAERLLRRLPAEDALIARARHRDADVGALLGDEDADQGVARGRVAEFRVGGRDGVWKATRAMISPGSSAVSNRPVKNSAAGILRLLVTIVAPSATQAAG